MFTKIISRLTKTEEQKTQIDRKTATKRMAPKMMKSCSSFAKESSQITSWRVDVLYNKGKKH